MGAIVWIFFSMFVLAVTAACAIYTGVTGHLPSFGWGIVGYVCLAFGFITLLLGRVDD